MFWQTTAMDRFASRTPRGPNPKHRLAAWCAPVAAGLYGLIVVFVG